MVWRNRIRQFLCKPVKYALYQIIQLLYTLRINAFLYGVGILDFCSKANHFQFRRFVLEVSWFYAEERRFDPHGSLAVLRAVDLIYQVRQMLPPGMPAVIAVKAMVETKFFRCRYVLLQKLVFLRACISTQHILNINAP